MSFAEYLVVAMNLSIASIYNEIMLSTYNGVSGFFKSIIINTTILELAVSSVLIESEYFNNKSLFWGGVIYV